MECIIPFGIFMMFAMILVKIMKRAGVVRDLAKLAWGGSKASSWSSTRGVGSARRRVRELESFMRERNLTGIELDTAADPVREQDPAPLEELLEEPIEELYDEPIEEWTEEPIEELVEEPTVELFEEPIEELVEEPIEAPVEELTPEPAPVPEPAAAPPPDPPAPAGPPPPAPRELAQTLFDSASVGSAVEDRFERQYRGTRATWSGVIDRVERFTDDPDLGPGPGLRLEAEVPPPEGEYGRAVRIICALPLETESDLGGRGDHVDLEGTLVSCDPYLWRFSLSHGRLR